MRTLFLTSGGVRFPAIRSEFIKLIPKPLSSVNLAYVTTASKVSSDTSFVSKDRDVLKELGINLIEIDISGKSEDDLRKLFSNIDIVYMQGGNGFYLLSEVYRTGFDKVLNELLDFGVLYVGVSAGTYIACPTIEMHEWKAKKDNHYGLKSMKALGLVPFLISVHYAEKYRENVIKGIENTDLDVRILTDEQAILVEGENVKFLGVGDEVRL